MASRRVTLLATVALAILGVVGWFVIHGRDVLPPSHAPHPRAAERRVAAGAAGAPERVRGAGLIHERAEVGLEVGESTTSPAGRDGVLRGRVLSDVLDAPLPGATVTISRRRHSEFMIPDAEERNSRECVVEVVTDDAGRFEVAVPNAVPLDARVSARGHGTARRDHVVAGADVEFRLSAASTVEVVLTRASDGSPVEGALVVGRDSRRSEQCRARSDLNGCCSFEDLLPGMLTVEVTPVDAALPPSRRIELRPGERARLGFALEDGVRVHGVVSDPNGQPIAGAEVGLGAAFRRSTRTDANGEYELLGVGGAKRRDLADVRARAEGHGHERKRFGDLELSGDTRLDFVLHRARVATGRVIDHEGGPIEGAYVAGVGSKTVAGVSRSDWESAVTSSDGRFELSTLHLLIDHQLFLRKEGYGTRVYDFPADEDERGRIDYGDLVLHSAGRVEGVLMSQTGEPIPDHLVKLRGVNADLGRFRPDAAALKKTWVTAVRHSRTDTQGRFHFSDLPGGSFRVTATVPGRPGAKAEQAVQLSEGGRVAGIEMTLDLGNSITGVVRTPGGAPAVGVFVQVAGDADQPRIRARSGADGRFELFGVTEAMGVVELFTIVASYNWYNPDEPLGASQTAHARAGDSEISLWLRDLVSMSGRVEDAAGDAVAGVQILAYRSGAARVPAAVLTRATSDGSGAFGLDLPEQCLVDLVTVAPKSGSAAEASQEGLPDRVVLERVASDSRGVVIRLGR